MPAFERVIAGPTVPWVWRLARVVLRRLDAFVDVLVEVARRRVAHAA
jgi:hypothetical protein